MFKLFRVYFFLIRLLGVMYKCFEVMGNKCESDIHGGRKNHSLFEKCSDRSQLLQLFEDKCELSESEKLWHQATQLFDFSSTWGSNFTIGGREVEPL